MGCALPVTREPQGRRRLSAEVAGAMRAADFEWARTGLRPEEMGREASSEREEESQAATVVAVARKLGILLDRLWVSGEPYQPHRHRRWQHPFQPNNNWRRARHQELTLECVWKQGGTDNDRQDNEGRAQTGRQPKTGQSLPFPPQVRIWRRGHPSRLPYGSPRSALTGTRPTPREETGRREWQETNGQKRVGSDWRTEKCRRTSGIFEICS
jgi:hypothetical protein